MPTYYAFGLRIRADLELLGYHEASHRVVGPQAAPDVEIKRSSLDRATLAENNEDGDVIAGQAPGILRYIARHGSDLLYDPNSSTDISSVQNVVGGELMSAILRQRGLLPLHGSCVSKEGKAIGFLGHSGWGKSTTAALLCKQGYQLVADDVLVVDLSHDQPMVRTGPSHQKLVGEAAGFLKIDLHGLPLSHNGKHIVDQASIPKDDAMPLAQLFILRGTAEPANTIITMSKADAVVEFLTHTRAARLFSSSTYQADHLKACGTLAAHVPTHALHRTLQYKDADDLQSLLVDFAT